jgi:hypothetical protein
MPFGESPVWNFWVAFYLVRGYMIQDKVLAVLDQKTVSQKTLWFFGFLALSDGLFLPFPSQ